MAGAARSSACAPSGSARAYPRQARAGSAPTSSRPWRRVPIRSSSCAPSICSGSTIVRPTTRPPAPTPTRPSCQASAAPTPTIWARCWHGRATQRSVARLARPTPRSMPRQSPVIARARCAHSIPAGPPAAHPAEVAAERRARRTERAMSATATQQRSASSAGEEKSAISAMAFVSDSTAMARISADLFSVTLGKANIRDGTIDAALAIGDWPRDLDLLIVDLGGAADPVADAAALKTAVPGGCIVIGVGRINDVALYRDLMAVGFNDYLALPLAEGAMGRAVERTLELRDRGAGPAGSAAKSAAKPRTLCVVGARGGVGATTLAVTLASMLGTRLQEDVL